MMTSFFITKVLPVLLLLVSLGGLFAYGKIEHAGKLKAEAENVKLLNDFQAEKDLADRLNKAKVDLAEENLLAEQARADAVEKALTAVGITKLKTEKDLKDAYDKLGNLDTANKLLWKQSQTNGNSDGEDSVTPMLPLPGKECDATSSRLETVENSTIFEVANYNACIRAIKAAYGVVGQEVHFDDQQ